MTNPFLRKRKTMLTVNAIRCAKCKYFLFSRDVKELRVCKCFSEKDFLKHENFYVGIRGGREYLQTLGTGFDVYTLELSVTNEQLIEDLRNFSQKYGLFADPKKEDYILSYKKVGFS